MMKSKKFAHFKTPRSELFVAVEQFGEPKSKRR